MAGKRATPEQVSQVVVLREAGYTTAMISSEVGLSPATVKRIYTAQNAKKGAVSKELVEKARNDVINSIADNDKLKAMTAKLIQDNLAINELIRDKVVESVSKLEPVDTETAALSLRGLTAASTSIKNTSDAVRSLLSFDHLNGDVEGLETLTYYDLTEEDIKEMRRQQEEEMKIVTGTPENNEENIVSLVVDDECEVIELLAS